MSTGSRVTGEDDPARAVASAFPVTDRKSWVAIFGMALLLAGAFVWLSLGQVPQTVRGDAIVVPSSGFIDIAQDVDGVVSEVLVIPGESVSEGDIVARVDRGSERLDVRAPGDGTIATILERVGGTTAPGQPLMTMSYSNEAEMVVGFVPANTGSIVKVGMPALVALSTFPESQYGTMTGTVTNVSTLPATADRVDLLVGGNNSLVDYFTQAGPVLEITVRLDPDPASATGYAWTIGNGPDQALPVGTLAQLTVVTSEGSPLGRFLQ